MITVLKLKFKSNLGKTRFLKIAYPKDKLDAATVKKAMNMIIESGLFVKGDEHLFSEPVAAYYVSTNKEPVFADEADADSENEAA